MTRAVAISAVLACLVMGCVSLGPAQTTLPSQPTLPASFSITTQAPIPSVSVTAAPTAAPEPTATPPQEATPGATVAPTVTAPSDTPAATLTPAPSVAVIEDFGADELLFADDFSDPTSGFGVGTTAGGTVAYVDGALQFDTAADGAWMWSRRTHSEASPVIRVEADMTPSADGYAGLLCANSDDELWGAVTNTAGMWAFVGLDSEGVSILTSNLEADWDLAPGVTTSIVLDCAGAETGAFRMQLSLPGSGLAALYETSDGPDTFDRVGVYAESSGHPFQLLADNLAAYGGDGENGMSPAAQALLLHVPADWRPDCFETPPPAFDTGALAALACQLTDGSSNVVDFVQFDTQANMDSAYQARVDTWAVDSTATCATGPNEGPYTIDTATAGRILCAPQTSGIRLDWTHDALWILSTLTNFDGSYPDIYQDWQIAGPE